MSLIIVSMSANTRQGNNVAVMSMSEVVIYFLLCLFGCNIRIFVNNCIHKRKNQFLKLEK